MKRILLGVLLVFLLVGCATTPTPISPMQMRQFTTRNFEGAYENVFRATMTILQDQGYMIKNTDMSSGLIVAQIDKETSGGSQFMQVLWAGYIWDKGTVIETSVTVNKLNEEQSEIRMTIQEVNYGQYNNKNAIKTITDPKVYDVILNEVFIEVKRREAINSGAVPTSVAPSSVKAKSLSVRKPTAEDQAEVNRAFNETLSS
jgi:hypothetical protein